MDRNDDGTVSEEFWRYNNEWRAAVRQFQEDLGQGKYDPQWLAEGAQAMEERARGDFDAWKEKEFEEFWGQKQRVSHTARAGTATNVKLSTLVEYGLFQIGDVWSYARCFGRGDQAIVIEKDCELVGMDSTSLTFEIPTGTRRYLGKAQSGLSNGTHEAINGLPVRSSDDESPAVEVSEAKRRISVEVPQPNKRIFVEQNAVGYDISLASSPLSSARSDITEPDWSSQVISKRGPLVEQQESSAPSPKSTTYRLHTLTALETKICNVDGRVTDLPNGNAWKTFRLIRQNQDLGSLFDVRDKYCVDLGI